MDGQNRRIAKMKNGAMVKQWLYRDQLHPAEELDASGNLLTRFLYATGRNSPDYILQNNAEYRVLSDQLGSPRLIVDANTGEIAQRMREDEFGNVLEDTSPGFTPFGFAGGLYDPDTGLVRFGARDYDPVVGRWISKDPIRFGGGQANLYVYVGDDPVNSQDLTGLEPPTSFWPQPLSTYFQAEDSAEHFFHIPAGGLNGQGDAYRHCFASCSLTQSYGSSFANLLGWLNEQISSDPPDESQMDTKNNACGRDRGNDPKTDCALSCLSAAQSGQLTTIP